MKAATATTHITNRSSRREAARPTAIQQGSLACGDAAMLALPGLRNRPGGVARHVPGS